MAKFLIDTCVLINALKGEQEELEFLRNKKGLVVSYLVHGELLQGVRNKRDLNDVDDLVGVYELDWGSSEQGEVALGILRKYYLSQGVGLIDSLIAATAIQRNLVLVTDNVKHFRNIKGLRMKRLSEVVE